MAMDLVSQLRRVEEALIAEQHQRREAIAALARIIRTTPLPGVVFNTAQDFFDAYRYDSAEVEAFAQDGRGPMNLHLDGDRPSDDETEINS